MTTDVDPQAIGTDATEKPRKSSRLPVILGLFLAIAGAAGGFAGVRLGLVEKVLNRGDAPTEAAATPPPGLRDVVYLALDPLIINLPSGSDRDLLRFTAQLEVEPAYSEDVEILIPRIVDVLNGYLRALDLSDLEDPASLNRIRAQLLRRVQVVAGEGRVRDLLIMEFVLN